MIEHEKKDKVIVMDIGIDKLFSDVHKLCLQEAISSVKDIDLFHTVVVTPGYLINKTSILKQGTSDLRSYKITIVSDYKLISAMTASSAPSGVKLTQEEQDLISTESLFENIYEQYSDAIQFQ